MWASRWFRRSGQRVFSGKWAGRRDHLPLPELRPHSGSRRGPALLTTGLPQMRYAFGGASAALTCSKASLLYRLLGVPLLG